VEYESHERDSGLAPPKRELEKAREREGGSNSVVESQPSKLLVAGSIPVSRSSLRSMRELRLGKPPEEACRAEARSAQADYDERIAADLSAEAERRPM
jgi:hypothetical protein